MGGNSHGAFSFLISGKPGKGALKHNIFEQQYISPKDLQMVQDQICML